MMRPPLLTTLISFILLTASSALAQATGSGTGGGSTGPGPGSGGTAPGAGAAAGLAGTWTYALSASPTQDTVTKEVGLSVTQRKSVPPRAGACGMERFLPSLRCTQPRPTSAPGMDESNSGKTVWTLRLSSPGLLHLRARRGWLNLRLPVR
jgi:hypothetical protein